MFLFAFNYWLFVGNPELWKTVIKEITFPIEKNGIKAPYNEVSGRDLVQDEW